MASPPRSEFDRLILPHLPAAYSLARWMLRQPHDAEDAVQDATVRAFRSFGSYAGGSPRAWLLSIVRNTCLTALERRRGEGNVIVLAGAHERLIDTVRDPAPAQDAVLIEEEERRLVHAAIAALPVQFREVVVLREFEELSYREIADVVGAPIGTVMSRLARARERLAAALDEQKPAARRGS